MAESLDDHDESVRIAIRALGDMRNARTSPTQNTVATQQSEQSAFVSRMSNLPFVNSALQIIEQGKASSRVVKYGAGIVESSVKSISRPVIDRLPVNQLDEFACRQLDRFDRYRRPSNSEGTPTPASLTASSSKSPAEEQVPSGSRSGATDLDGSAVEDEPDDRTQDQDVSMDGDGVNGGKNNTKPKGEIPRWLQASSPFVAPPPTPPDSGASTPIQEAAPPPGPPNQVNEPQQNERQVAQRSRWQAMLLEAGGLSAALSEESMRRLKYCLHWLQYATAHIDAQILILRDFIASLQPLSPHPHPHQHPISQAHMRTLHNVQRDIVHTIRQVVDVLSRYAGGALPEPARTRVRGFILKLPQRWATRAGPGPEVAGERDRERDRESVAAASGTGTGRRGHRRAVHSQRGTGAESHTPARPGSASSSRAASPNPTRTAGAVSPGAATAAAQKILVLATESLDMVRGVTGVVKDSLDRADAWVGRLRTVGIQRTPSEAAAAEDPPPPRDRDQGQQEAFELGHRRQGSAQSDFDADAPPSPYFGSSNAGGSSIPSTPGGGTHSPVYTYAGGTRPGSPGQMGLGLSAMSLGSRYSTPRSGVVGLPEVEDKGARKERAEGEREGEGVEEIMDVEKMDVDGS